MQLKKKNVKEIEEGIKTLFGERKIEFIPILTKEVKIDKKLNKKPFGLDELFQKTKKNFYKSSDSFSYHYIYISIQNYIKNNILNYQDKIDIKDLHLSIYEFYEKLFGNLNKDFKDLIRKHIDLLKNFQEALNYNESIDELISDFMNYLIKKLQFEQVERLINNIFLSSDIKSELKKELKPK